MGDFTPQQRKKVLRVLVISLILDLVRLHVGRCIRWQR